MFPGARNSDLSKSHFNQNIITSPPRPFPASPPAPAMAQPHPHIQATTLRSLQRVDPGITKTLAQAGYVVAYREVTEGGWEKMGVEGGLFVYER